MNLFDAFLKLLGWRPIVDPEVTMRPLETLWHAAIVDPSWRSTLSWYKQTALKGVGKYEIVSKQTGVPWQVVAVIHGLEAGFSWTKHLHNGDPLSAKTVQVPRGRPLNPSQLPVPWVESAVDAMEYDCLDDVDWDDLEEGLLAIEKYNGLGYRKLGINSPYLWSATQHYKKGKFVGDHKFSKDAVSKQVGAVPLLKELGWQP